MSLIFYFTVFVGLFIIYKILTRKTKFPPRIKYIPEDDDNYGVYEKDGKSKTYSTSNPSESIDIQFSAKGFASYKSNPPQTIFQVLDKAVELNPDDNLMAKEYPDDNGTLIWKYWNRSQVYNEVTSAARGFISLGLLEWESVCIMGFNSPQWMFADLAAIYGGGIACGLYTTNNEGQCQYIVNHSKGRILVLENRKLLNKFINIQDNLKYVTAIVLYNDDDAVIEYNKNKSNNNSNKFVVITWDDLINKYGNKDVDKYNAIMNGRKSKILATNCCTLIYTSGTTGKPKGVMLSHDNITLNIKSILFSQKGINWWDKGCQRHSVVSYLPLSHIAAQMLDLHGPLAMASKGGTGTVYFARSDALKGSLNITLKFVKPTVFLGVPRVWEKIEEKMKLIGKNGNFVIKKISKLSKSIGLIAAYNRSLNGNNNIPFGYSIINQLIFNTIKSKLGFSDLKLAITGAAPIRESTLKYFHSIGIPLIEAYGMSETTALSNMGLEYYNIIKSVGPSLPGCNVICDNTTGEILIRGRNIMMGYIYDKDKTDAAIDKNNGYLHTGDIGRIDVNTNLLYITGRIKELIITAGGENIAPIPIENYIKTIRPALSNIILIGDKRKYLTILVTLKCKESSDNDGDRVFTNDLSVNAIEVDKNCKTVSEAKKSGEWEMYIKSGIDDYNNNKEICVSKAQRIQYYRILDNDFSIKTNELTSTLKLKRNIIINKYKDIIDDMY